MKNIKFFEEFTYKNGKNQLEEQFNKLYENWLLETGVLSDTDEILENENHLSIIKMGKEVIPFIFEKLNDESRFLFNTLEKIVGSSPVPKDTKDLEVYHQYWKEWYKNNYEI